MSSHHTAAIVACLFPGQGSQRKGMGGELFDRFDSLCTVADDILGYSIKKLCLEDPERNLRHTAYTQPALFVVNALTWLRRAETQPPPGFLAGHSLGEYNALFAAGCIDFATGLRMVQRRGELMSRVQEGGMAAVLNLPVEDVQRVLREQGAAVDIANFNLPGQLVLSGPKEDLESLIGPLEQAGARKCVVLNVSGAFHSRYMASAAQEFEDFLRPLSFSPPSIPVLANTSAKPYDVDHVAENLVAQIRTSVRWSETLQYLADRSVSEVEELGPGKVLTKMWAKFVEVANPAGTDTGRVENNTSRPATGGSPKDSVGQNLGSAEFRSAYGLDLAYLPGSSAPGMRTAQFVAAASRSRLFAFLDVQGESREEIRAEIAETARLCSGPFGICLWQGGEDSQLEAVLVDEALSQQVRSIEALGYYRITPALVRFRFRGAHRDREGQAVVPHRLLASVSRVGTASLFLNPPPHKIIEDLLHQKLLTAEEGEIARDVPLASDLCALTGSSHGTDLSTLLPSLLQLRDRLAPPSSPRRRVPVGAGGALGTPDALACAFFLGADFVQTGAINLCAVESAAPKTLKALLASLEPGDTTSAPAASGFSLGSRVQVVKRGSFFAARAQKLYELYRFYPSIEAIPASQREKLESSTFRRTLESVWREVQGEPRPEAAETDPKHKMAQVFSWYLRQSQRWALQGNESERLNFQIPCDESVAAFNLSVADTGLSDLSQRTASKMADWLMARGEALLRERLHTFRQH
ncbi:MAG: ACP S-malonyltransferase [Deltaproteobacteria bacterium]|nr:ACP S-malonyltransferase [Deltaproteobacteria bacterium]